MSLYDEKMLRGMTNAAQAEPWSKYHETADAWRIARENLDKANRASEEAIAARDSARAAEETAWYALFEASGRAPKVAEMPYPTGQATGQGVRLR